MKRVLRAASIALFALLLVAAVIVWLNLRDEAPVHEQPFSATPAQVERGAYLARAGNCAACHTARGGAPYAGGRPIDTPFGLVYGSNLTPDKTTGIGTWSADHFWRALHNGRSRDGRLLSPAFPYANFTQVTREDSDALFGYLRSLPAVAQRNRPHELSFPLGTQAALAVWRALFFRPQPFVPDATRSAEFNRGAYLVQALGHCSACHGARNAFGAVRSANDFEGGELPAHAGYAPSLTRRVEAGVADWRIDEVVALLKTGVSYTNEAQGSALGPMAEVVFRSTQHLSDMDLRAMAVYLQALPPSPPPKVRIRPTEPPQMRRGAEVYEARCADCHGKAGEGAFAGEAGSGRRAVPPLAGNRAVTMHRADNAILAVIRGGFPPATAGNPRPFGMPPLGQDLNDDEIAAVVTFIRNSWGNQAGAVRQHEVTRLR
jgi:mono/diheme cytochrome c family protein